MAGFFRASSSFISSSCCKCYSRILSSSSSLHRPISSLVPNTPISAESHPSAHFRSAISPQKSPMEYHILRILRTAIDCRSQYAPPHQPVTKFDAVTVEDRPGEQFTTLRRNFAEDEHIKIEATMFDGAVVGPKSGYESSGQDVRLHISLLVDIWRGEGEELLEFVCSAWPEALEIQKVYRFKRGALANKIYMGPNVRDLKENLRCGFYEFMKRRGVSDELAIFLHQYMMNKDKIELIQWMEKVELFIEK